MRPSLDQHRASIPANTVFLMHVAVGNVGHGLSDIGATTL